VDSRWPDNSDTVHVRWTLGEPLPPIEAVDVLTLTESETLAYVRDLQHEVGWLRRALREALTLTHQLTVHLDRAGARIQQLLAALRALRAARQEQSRS
jgi:hypothetical protein